MKAAQLLGNIYVPKGNNFCRYLVLTGNRQMDTRVQNSYRYQPWLISP